MSISEQATPEFTQAFRGYDRAQVDEYVVWMRDQVVQSETRAGRAETALAQCRRELASSPTTAGISERLTAMLQLATEEAADIRTRAQTDSDATVADAFARAERTVDEANRLRDAIQREIDDLSTIPRAAAAATHRARRRSRRRDGALPRVPARQCTAPGVDRDAVRRRCRAR